MLSTGLHFASESTAGTLRVRGSCRVSVAPLIVADDISAGRGDHLPRQ